MLQTPLPVFLQVTEDIALIFLSHQLVFSDDALVQAFFQLSHRLTPTILPYRIAARSVP